MRLFNQRAAAALLLAALCTLLLCMPVHGEGSPPEPDNYVAFVIPPDDALPFPLDSGPAAGSPPEPDNYVAVATPSAGALPFPLDSDLAAGGGDSGGTESSAVAITTFPIAIPASMTPFPTSPAPEMPLLFSGSVLRGASWESATGEEWAVVECYCSGDPRETGHLAASAVTGPNGTYSLVVNETCRFYTLSLPGEPPSSAESVSGTVLPGGLIRYEEPLAGKTLTGNRFFHSTSGTAGPETPSGTPVPAGTRFATSPTTPLPAALVVLGILAGTLAVLKKRAR